MLTASEEAEINELAGRLGRPIRWQREYEATNPRNAEWVRRMMKRRGEVIVVVPRPGERVLLHTKSTYPDGTYRLPGGGINRGEPVLEAAQRETKEEMGFDLPMEHFLGVVENGFRVDGERLTYPSYVFLAPVTTESPRVMDPDERISGFQEKPLDSLGQVASELESLPPDWQPWGYFRAAPHALALEALKHDRG